MYQPLATTLAIFLIVILLLFVIIVLFEVKKKSKSEENLKSTLNDLYKKSRAIDGTYEIYKIILESLDFEETARKIANLIPQKFGYETGVVAMVDNEKKVLKRVAISETTGGRAALQNLNVDFNKIDIPLTYSKNYCIKALDSGKQQIAYRLYDVLSPAVSKKNSDLVQGHMGTTVSLVNPLYSKGKPVGVFIVSMSKSPESLTDYEKVTIERFSDMVGVALQNSLLYSESQKVSEQLKLANKKLKELDQRKDEFISIASHELKTPLAIVNTNLWMLDRISTNLNIKQKKFVHESQRGLKRMSRVVNNLLDISRIEQGRFTLAPSEHSVHDFIYQTVEDFKEMAAEKGLKLHYKTEEQDKGMVAQFDKDRLDEVLGNFISNAIKYTEQGEVVVYTKKTSSKVRVSIKDTGPGISKADMDKIFTKFGRAGEGLKRSAVGASTGLGLYISKKIVQEMGGKVGFDSKVGQGSTFWFELPCKDCGKNKKQKVTTINPNEESNKKTNKKIKKIKQQVESSKK